MGQYVGLDVSLETTTVHVLDEQGKRVGTCVSHPAAIAATIRKHAPDAVRIGLETGPLTTWLWQALTDAGLPMVCLDARQAKAALNMRINKTDDTDAEGLAQLVRGTAKCGSRAARPCWLIGARAQLLDIVTELSNQIRGLMKTVPKGAGTVFECDVFSRMTRRSRPSWCRCWTPGVRCGHRPPTSTASSWRWCARMRIAAA
jgi:transposase